jgi:predicted RNA-binding Zn-ribbon protein involved in translation (DUF1610 family)
MPVTPRKRLRIALTLAMYVAAGIITSIVIAWTQFLDGPHRIAYPLPETESASGDQRHSGWIRTIYSRHFIAYRERGEPLPQLPNDPSALADELRGSTYNLPAKYPYDVAASNANWSAHFQGFPMHCVWGWEISGGFAIPNSVSQRGLLNPAFSPGYMMGGGWYHPRTPVWTGLLVNTVFWALIWVAAVRITHEVFPAIMNAIPHSKESRRRRGLCTTCGYDLTGCRHRCPECGSRITQTAQTQKRTDPTISRSKADIKATTRSTKH